MAVTQKQIADELGVSQVLVSYALSGNPRVNNETRDRIVTTAQRMGYSAGSNRAAKALIAKRHGTKVKTGLLAVLLPHLRISGAEMPLPQNPYYHDILTGIESEAESSDMAVLLCSAARANLLEFLDSQQVDGVISLTYHPSLSAELEEMGLPRMVIGKEADGGNCLIPGDRQGAHLATQHLIALGHSAIGYLGFHEHFYEGCERAGGYRDAMREAGIDHGDRWMETSMWGFEKAPEVASALVRRSPEMTAIVCFNDIIAMHVVQVLTEQGLSVPGDISVTGFDDVSSSTFFTPSITSIWYDRLAMGHRAVELISKEDAGTALTREIFPVTLRIHDSTAAPRAS